MTFVALNGADLPPVGRWMTQRGVTGGTVAVPEGNGEGESRGRGEGETRGEGEGEKKGEGEGETRGEREGEVWAGAGWSERGPWTSGDRREGGGAAEQGGEGGRRERVPK